MIAWADWELPEDESAPKPKIGLRPPPGLNLEFCAMACDAAEDMRAKVLKGRKYYSKPTQRLYRSEYQSY